MVVNDRDDVLLQAGDGQEDALVDVNVDEVEAEDVDEVQDDERAMADEDGCVWRAVTLFNSGTLFHLSQTPPGVWRS